MKSIIPMPLPADENGGDSYGPSGAEAPTGDRIEESGFHNDGLRRGDSLIFGHDHAHGAVHLWNKSARELSIGEGYIGAVCERDALTGGGRYVSVINPGERH